MPPHRTVPCLSTWPVANNASLGHYPSEDMVTLTSHFGAEASKASSKKDVPVWYFDEGMPWLSILHAPMCA